MARLHRVPTRLLPALRALRQRPQLLGCGCVPVLALLIVVALLLGRRCVPDGADTTAGSEETTTAPGAVEADANPRLLLNRVWFDRLPEKATDDVDLWIFLAGGVALHEKGSSYRASFDLLEFERRGSTLDARHLHDKKRLRTDFQVRGCDDHAPFTLCLTLDSVGGKKLELYGFGDEEDLARHAPSARSVMAAARARAATAR